MKLAVIICTAKQKSIRETVKKQNVFEIIKKDVEKKVATTLTAENFTISEENRSNWRFQGPLLYKQNQSINRSISFFYWFSATWWFEKEFSHCLPLIYPPTYTLMALDFPWA